MAITINKTKAKKKTATKKKVAKKVASKTEKNTALDYVRSIADEAGILKDKIAIKKLELSDLNKEYSMLVDPIQVLIDKDFDAKATTHATGKDYTCKVGAKGNKTIINDVMGVFNFFNELGGEDLLAKVMKFGVTDIKNYLTNEEQDSVIEIEPTGSRRIDFIKK